MRLKKGLCIVIAGITILSLTACAKNTPVEEPSISTSEAPQVDETITSTGIELITGIVTKLDGSTVSTNGVYMTEAQVGQVAKTFTSENYKCERKSLKEEEVKFVSILYNIDNKIACSIYFDEQMNMYFNNKFLIIATDVKTMYKELAESITTGSIIEFPKENSNNTNNDENNIVNPNNDLSISTAMLQTNIGLDEQTARVLAESASKVGVPTIMKAQMAAQDIIRTYDINNNSYLIAIQDGAIVYIYNETTIMYMYAIDGYDTRIAPNVPNPNQPIVPSVDVEQTQSQNNLLASQNTQMQQPSVSIDNQEQPTQPSQVE